MIDIRDNCTECLCGCQPQSRSYVEEEVEVAMGGTQPSVEKTGTVAFHEPNINPVTNFSHANDAVALVDGTPDQGLGKFLSRPTLIDTTTWTQADALDTDIATMRPFYDFFNNTRIKKKIDNFAYIRGNLHLKFVINSTPFNYGYARAVYNPAEGFSRNPITGSTFDSGKTLVYSQFPHVELLPHNSQGGEMVLPNMIHTNWYDLASASFLQNSGTLRIRTFSQLLSANGQATYKASILTYAWMTDVELMGPTVALAVQSDEYCDNGPISGPASTISSIASVLSSVPVIAPFARATEMVATTVGAVARMFGYSNPPEISNPKPVQQSNLPHLASGHISTVHDKLSLDPKCELSIDTSNVDGDKLDPLIIKHFVQREAMLLANVLVINSLSVGQCVFNARVNPCLYITNPIVGTVSNLQEIYPTPLAYGTEMFRYWRGDLKFRFKFVVSKYHKGRIRITYDPRGDAFSDSDTVNTSITRIVDIGEEDDIEFIVPYHQRTTWLKTRSLTNGTSDDGNWAPGNNITPDYAYDNGTLNVRINSAISAPVSTANIILMVFVSAGDNFEVAVPQRITAEDAAGALYQLPIQSASYDEDKVTTGVVEKHDFSDTKQHEQEYAFTQGEVIRSFRTLMSRSVITRNYNLPNTASNQCAHLRILFPRFPAPPGYNSASSITAVSQIDGVSTIGYDPAPWDHPLHWYVAPFKGYRGGLHHRWNIETKGFQAVDKFMVMRHGLSRVASDTIGKVLSTLSTTGVTNNKMIAYWNTVSCNSGLGGAAHTAQRNNNSLNVVCPDYNMYNFRYYVPGNVLLGTSTDDSDIDTYSVHLFTKPTDSTAQASNQVTFTQYASIGVDFVPIFFLACPVLYYTPSYPTVNN